MRSGYVSAFHLTFHESWPEAKDAGAVRCNTRVQHFYGVAGRLRATELLRATDWLLQDQTPLRLAVAVSGAWRHFLGHFRGYGHYVNRSATVASA